ncbi:hypothetical protein JYT83_00830 [bacterium AH-315-F18]|nr:hypothetical protein [bacterium AH-315-F18]
MIGAIAIVMTTMFMARLASLKNAPTLAWGAITFVICCVCSVFIPIFVVDIVVGFAVSLAVFKWMTR